MADDAPLPDPAETPARPWWRERTALPGWAALGVALVALGLAAAPYVSGGSFGGGVRAYLIANPGVLEEVIQARQTQADSQRTEAINTAARNNPALLALDPRDPTFGPADAKVTVIEFFDFRCPGCKAVAHDYRALMAAHPEVRFVFKDWPILDRGEDVTSQYAARAALAAHAQGKYLEVYDALMSEPAMTVESIDRVLTEHGVNLVQARAALASPEISRHVADIHTTAAALGLQGTPTFFVNGRASASIDPADIAKLIEAAKR